MAYGSIACSELDRNIKLVFALTLMQARLARFSAVVSADLILAFLIN